MKERVVISGATGFLGGALTSRLLGEGWPVAVVQRPQAPTVDDRCARITWEGDPFKLVQGIKEWKPRVIFHLATHFVAQHETNDLSALIEANISLGTALLEAAETTGSRIVITGSAWQHFDGADYYPVSLYASMKQALFDIAVHYKNIGVDVREVSFFDTYGPLDKRRKLVPLLLQAAETGRILDMSSGEQLIDLLYVSDAVSALIAASTTHEPHTMEEARFVARSSEPITIKALVAEVQKIVEKPLSVRWGARPNRQREMIRDWHFGLPVPDWTPTMPLSRGVDECWRHRLDQTQGGRTIE